MTLWYFSIKRVRFRNDFVQRLKNISISAPIHWVVRLSNEPFLVLLLNVFEAHAIKTSVTKSGCISHRFFFLGKFEQNNLFSVYASGTSDRRITLVLWAFQNNQDVIIGIVFILAFLKKISEYAPFILPHKLPQIPHILRGLEKILCKQQTDLNQIQRIVF